MKKVVYTRPDGGLSVVNPVRNTLPGVEDLTDEELLQLAMKAVPADATNVHVVDSVPADRTFRNAWTVVGGVVVHDMDKCRDIQRDRIRQARVPVLAALDVEFMKAVEAGDTATQAEVAAKKQALRDLPDVPSIDAAKTPEDLKAIDPAALVAQAIEADTIGIKEKG